MAKKTPAKKKTKRRTVADKPKGKRDPKSLAEQLGKPFSLPDCKRLIALAEMYVEKMTLKAATQVQKKVLTEDYHQATDTRDREKAALRMVEAVDTIKACNNSMASCVGDLMKLLVSDLANGATVWAAAAENAAAADAEIDDPATDNPLNFKGDGKSPDPKAE